MNRLTLLLRAGGTLAVTASAADLPPLDFGGVREEHAMVPMRDGKKLSVYLYVPKGVGSGPPSSSNAMRKSPARARAGGGEIAKAASSSHS